MPDAQRTTHDARRPWVLVTGGARRLGRCLCETFAQAGWNVAIHHSQSGEQAQALCGQLQDQGAQAVTVAGTLDTPEAVAELFDAAWRATRGALHTIVCNASAFEPDTGRAMDPALLLRQLQVNLVAPMQLGSMLHSSLKDQREQGHTATPLPSIVHVLDQKVFNLNPDYFSYTLSKLALERAVALQAQALAPQVRVNAVAPGLMYVSGPQSADNFARASRVNLLHRAIDPADVARAAVFLAGNAGCTGTTISVDNGQRLVPLGRDVMFALDHIQPGILPDSAV